MALTAMLVGLFRNTLSSDVLSLSMGYAERMAKEAGVSEAEWVRVKEIALRAWQRESSKNPLKGMF